MTVGAGGECKALARRAVQIADRREGFGPGRQGRKVRDDGDRSAIADFCRVHAMRLVGVVPFDGSLAEVDVRPGFARIFEAMSGFTQICGEEGSRPLHPGYPISDAIAGLFGALGVLAALHDLARMPDRRGQEIDCSATEAMLRTLEFLAIEYDQLGTVWLPLPHAILLPFVKDDAGRVYDLYRKSRVLEPIPYALKGSVDAVVERQDPELKGVDFSKVIDNSLIDQLVKEKYFESVFGPSIREEQQRKQALAFGR